MKHCQIDFSEKEILDILNAIGVAKDEGYGPDGFGEGKWDEIENKLNHILNLIEKYGIEN